MNIRVFSPSDTTFTSNGNKSIKPISCFENKVLNCDQWMIDMELSIEYINFIQQDSIIVVPTKYGNQPFRTTNINVGDSIEFEAHHVGFDSKLFIIDSLVTTNLNAQECLDALVGATTDLNNFTAYSDIGVIKSLTFTNCTLYEALLLVQEAYGGYLDFNAWQFRLTSSLGADRGAVIEPGKHLEFTEVYEDWNSVCTTILPLGNNNLMLTPNTRSSVTTYDRPYTRVVKFNTSDTTELEALALAYLNFNSTPKVNYKVKSTLQYVFLNDEVQVRSKQYTLMANVLSYKYNTLSGLNEQVEFGNYVRTAKRAFSVINEMIEKVNNNTTVLNSLVAEQTKLINAAGTYGYCIKTENEIYFVDTLPIESAVNVMRQNVAGIGFSTNGINGPYTSAWTLNGNFNADFIKTGTLDVARIRGDLLDISGNIAITSRVTQASLNSQLENYSTLTQTAISITLAVGTKEDAFYKQATAPFNNLVTNGGYDDGLTGWTAYAVTTSVVDGELTQTGTAINARTYKTFPVVSGNKYYFAVYAKHDTTLTTNRFSSDNGTTWTVFITPTANNQYTWYSGIGTANSTSGRIEIARDSRSSGWTTQYIRDVILLDLTAIYGAGNEPTKEQMDQYIKRLWLDISNNTYKSFSGSGWIPSSQLTGAKYVFDGTNATFIGGGLIIKNNAGNTVFDADVNGDLQITGKLTALSGNVKGELTVGQNNVNAGLSGSGGLSTSIRFWAGTQTPSTASDFYVRDDGYLKSTKGSIAGWLLSANQFSKGGIILDSANERIYVGGLAYLYSYASGVMGISGQLRTTGNITSAGSINALGGLGVSDGQVSNLGNTVHVRFGTTKYLLTRDSNGFVKATTVITE